MYIYIMKEIYKDIVGYEGVYQISNNGKVKSLERIVLGYFGEKKITSRILKPSISRGYKAVNLFKSGEHKNVKIHRLVGLHFKENPNNYKCLNHIDGDKLNNNYWNLEWCNHLHNLLHARRLGLNKSEKKICQYDLNNNAINEFKSLADASNTINKYNSRGNISDCCSGKRKTAFGYKWKYIN